MTIEDVLRENNDPRLQSMQDRIIVLNNRIKTVKAEGDRHYEGEMAKIDAASRRALDQFDQKVKTEMEALTDTIERAKQWGRERRKEEQTDTQIVIERLMLKQQEEIDKTFDAFNKAKHANTRFREFHIRELPVFFIFAVPFITLLLLFRYLDVFFVALTDPLLWIIVTVSSATVSVLIGLLLRSNNIKNAERPYEEAKQLYEEKIDAAHHSSKAEIARIMAVASQKCSKEKTRRDTIEGKRNEIIQKANDKKAQIRNKFNSVTTKATAGMEAEKSDLQKQLIARTKGKSAKEQINFPPYQKAKSMGYDQGERPSTSDTDRLMKQAMSSFLDSLAEYESKIVMSLLKNLSDDQGIQLLEMLYKLPPYERSRKLKSIVK